MFVTSTINREGLFGIITYINGIKEQTLVDNYFPCKTQKPIFSRANGKELWVMIIEKVWAKIHQSFERIITGQSYEVFRDLLGAPSFYVKTNEDDILDILKRAFSKEYIMTATSSPTKQDTDNLMLKSILNLHSYSLLKYEKVTDREGMEQDLV